jgi:LDH2 family malate/lactate/ureidoglycolate dehydrogenase
MQADYHLLKKYVASVFTAIGCSEEEAYLASDVLVSASRSSIIFWITATHYMHE